MGSTPVPPHLGQLEREYVCPSVREELELLFRFDVLCVAVEKTLSGETVSTLLNMNPGYSPVAHGHTPEPLQIEQIPVPVHNGHGK